MFRKWFNRNQGEDQYQQELQNRRQEAVFVEEEMEEDSYYSVLIHFVPDRNNAYVYIVENEEILQGDACICIPTNFEDDYIKIYGNFVYYNGMESMDEVQQFMDHYQLVNPVIKRFEEAI